jgi:surface polysaccharide O-acyltransferase-like enzyme
LASVESFRVVAMFIVVSLHANFFVELHAARGGYGFVIDLPLYLLWWLSVPYFFLVAGYFYGEKVQAGHNPLSLLRASCASLIWLYLIWSVVYALIPPRWTLAFTEQSIWQTLSRESVLNWAASVSEHLRLYLMPWYSYYHLWFLPALIVGLGAAALATMIRLKRSAVPVLVALYVLLVTAELMLPDEGTRGNLVSPALLAMFFTLLGWWVAYRRPFSVSLAVGLMVGGGALAVTEGIVLKLFFHANGDQVSRYPYAGAVLLVLGLFMLLLAKPTWGQQTVLPARARYTLGVYVCHILIEHTLAPVRDLLPHFSVVWHVPYVIAVYTLSALLAWVLMHIPGLRTLVMRGTASPAGIFETVWPWARLRWSHQRSRQP